MLSAAEKFRLALRTVEAYFETLHQNVFEPQTKQLSCGFISVSMALVLNLMGVMYTILTYERNASYFATMTFIGFAQVRVQKEF